MALDQVIKMSTDFFIDSKEIQGWICSGSYDKPCITVFLKGGNKLIIPELDGEILDYLSTAKYDYPEGCYISSGGGVEKYTTDNIEKEDDTKKEEIKKPNARTY